MTFHTVTVSKSLSVFLYTSHYLPTWRITGDRNTNCQHELLSKTKGLRQKSMSVKTFHGYFCAYGDVKNHFKHYVEQSCRFWHFSTFFVAILLVYRAFFSWYTDLETNQYWGAVRPGWWTGRRATASHTRPLRHTHVCGLRPPSRPPSSLPAAAVGCPGTGSPCRSRSNCGQRRWIVGWKRATWRSEEQKQQRQRERRICLLPRSSRPESADSASRRSSLTWSSHERDCRSSAPPTATTTDVTFELKASWL